MNQRGRPMKYAPFIRALELEEHYAPSTVVRAGEAKGLFETDAFCEVGEPIEETKQRVRIAMNRLSARLPDEGDGFISEKGQQTLKGWYGWRWKEAIPAHFFDEDEKMAIRKCREAHVQKKEIVNKRGPRRRKAPFASNYRKLGLALTVLLAAGLFTAGFVATLYPRGVEIFKTQGPLAALGHFVEIQSFKRRDPVVAFGAAWAKYAIGNFEDAERESFDLIQDPHTPEVTVGNCFLLLGKIKVRTGPPIEAQDYFFKAIDIFERLDRPANLFKTYAAMAVLALENGDLGVAESYIEEALEINERAGMDVGEILHLQAELAFHREDYQLALEYSYRSYNAREKANNLPEMTNATIDIGFYLILTGQLEMGFEKTMEAQVLINQIGDQDKMYYNFINLLMVRRCEGRNYAVIESALLKHIDEKNDQKLLDLLHFAMAFPCGSGPDMGGEDDQTPPPNGM